MDIKRYNTFIKESIFRSSEIYPNRRKIDVYIQSIKDSVVNIINVEYGGAYIEGPNIYSTEIGIRSNFGYMCKILLKRQSISELERTDLMFELSHVCENIKIDYPNLNVCYDISHTGNYIYICLLDPIVDIDKISNVKLKSI